MPSDSAGLRGSVVLAIVGLYMVMALLECEMLGERSNRLGGRLSGSSDRMRTPIVSV
jgi:hypothetical protein